MPTSDSAPTETPPTAPIPSDESIPSYHIVISGYYGFDNVGDELILETLVQQLQSIPNPRFQLTVMSNDPSKTAAKYNVQAVQRTSYVDIADVFSRADLLISGGGGLFQDVTGPASPIYYGSLILIAKYFKMPVFFWGQGVGPLKTPLGRWFTKQALKQCDAITVRDEHSANLVGDLIGEYPEITADPVWAMDVSTIVAERRPPKDVWQIGLSLRPWKDLTEARIKAMAAFFGELANHADKPVRFMLFPFQYESDLPVLHQFKSALGELGHTYVCHWVSPDERQQTIAECHVFFGMRYHSLMMAVMMGVPIYGLIYDPKVQQLIDRFELGGIQVSRLEHLDDAIVRIYFGHYQQPDIGPIQDKARTNVPKILALLNEKMAEYPWLAD